MGKRKVSPQKKSIGDLIFKFSTWIWGVGILILVVGLFYYITDLAMPALHKFGFGFFVSKDWNPPFEQFGALPFFYGTLVSSLLAVVIALPITLCVSLFLTEIAPARVARVLSFFIEMLAAIPSVIYGLWGIFVFSPFLSRTLYPFLVKNFGPPSPVSKVLGTVLSALGFPLIALWNIFTQQKVSFDEVYQFFSRIFAGPSFGVSLMTASLILTLMILPTMTSLCREVFSTVPRIYKEALYALGSTRWEMMRIVFIKGCKTSIAASVILGLGRALGETMAVTMVIGNRNEVDPSLLSPAQTMASLIANEYQEAQGLHLSSLAAVGLALLLLSFCVNGLARLIIWSTARNLRGQ